MLAISLLGAGAAVAMDPNRALNQLIHSSWGVRNAGPPDVWSITQAKNGYLWLGTGDGLYSFDGVVFERFRPTQGPDLLADNVNAVFAASSGDIWVGYEQGGISRLRDGRLTNYPRTDLREVRQFVEGPDHAIWAGLIGGPVNLMRFDGARWQVVGDDWGCPEGWIISMLVSRDGTLWLATPDGLYFLRPGSHRFETTGLRLTSRTRLAQAPDGRIWLAQGAAGTVSFDTETLMARKAATWTPPPADTKLLLRLIMFDRDGNLWGSVDRAGLVRVPPPKGGWRKPVTQVQTYTLADGLTSNLVASLFEGSEGGVWIATNRGIDRLRAANVVAEYAIPATSRTGYRALRADARILYVADADTIYRLPASGPPKVIAKTGQPTTAFCTDRQGTTWATPYGRLLALRNDQAADDGPLPEEAKRTDAHHTVLSCAVDRSGTLWVSVEGLGLYSRQAGQWRRRIPAPELAKGDALVVADLQGRLWFYNGFAEGRPLVLVDGDKVRVFPESRGPKVGHLALIEPREHDVLFGGDDGLARFDGHRFQTLPASRTENLRRVAGVAQSAEGHTWLNTIRGVFRVKDSDLAAAFEHPERPLPHQLFDNRDGLPGPAQQDSDSPTALTGPDGRIWLVTSHGLAWIDPRRLAFNPTPPPVVVRSIRADGVEYRNDLDGRRLKAGVTRLQIDYAALSLTVPDRIRYRYRLDGVDRDWVDPGERRQAFYTKLGPGDYTFRVVGANNDGVWNRTGATVHFSIPPTFTQTWLFKGLCLLALLAFGRVLYSLRLRQVSEQIKSGLEERLHERERIARELHDTLLQGFQGLMLRFQAVADQIPREQPVHAALEHALERADDVLVEGRDRVRNLRIAGDSGDLAEAFANIGEHLSPDPTTRFRVVTTGKVRDLHPIVREEVRRIGEEAITNAFNHARAGAIDVAITYHPQFLRVVFLDDGVGLPANVLTQGGRDGHYGLLGMRERAEKIRTRFTLSSRPGSGVEIELTVPGAVAYASPGRRRWTPPWRQSLAEET